MPDNPLIAPNAAASAFNDVVMSLGDLAYDTTNKALRVGDGVTTGGIMIPNTTIVGMIVASAIAGKLDRSNTSGQNLNMGGGRIEALADPDSDDDAVNRGWVSAMLRGLQDSVVSTRVNRAGDVMAGPLNMSRFRLVELADAADDRDAVHRAYLAFFVARLQSIAARMLAAEAFGRTGDPVTGTALAANTTYLIDAPVVNDGVLETVRLFVRQPGTIKIARYRGSGTAYTLQAAISVNVATAGLVTLTRFDFGDFAVLAGDNIAFSGAGVIGFNSGSSADLYSWKSGSGDMPANLTAAAGATTSRIEIAFTTRYQVVTAGALAALQQAAGETATQATQATQAVNRLFAPVSQTIGRAGDLIDATRIGSGTVVLKAPVETDGTLQTVEIFAGSDGPLTLARYTLAGGSFTRVATLVVQVVAGLNTLKVNWPVLAGEYIGLAGAGRFTYDSSAPRDSYYLLSGSVPATASAAEANSFRFYIRLSILASRQVVTADSIAAISSRLDALGNGDATAKLIATLTASLTQVVGRTGELIDATRIGSPTIILKAPVENDGFLSTVEVFAGTAGTLNIARYTLANGTLTRVAATTAQAVAGLNVLNVNWPVLAGEYIGLAGNAKFTYDGSSPRDTYYQPAGQVPSTATATELNTNKFQIRLTYTATKQVVTAQALLAQDARLKIAEQEIDALQAAAPIVPVVPRPFSAWFSKVARIKQASTGKARIVVGGDSWAEYVEISGQLSAIMFADLGRAGHGWISGGSEELHLNGVTVSAANWDIYDASKVASPPAFGCASDGMCRYTTGTTATFTASGVVATDIRLYYAQTGGSFRYRVDAGAWTTVTGDGSNGLGIASITGLANAAHTLSIDTSVNNGGTVALFGAYATLGAAVGVEVLKMGNAGLASPRLGTYVDQYVAPVLADLQPDVIVWMMGTNDYRIGGSSPALMIATYRKLVAAIVAVSPQTGFVFVAPADTQTADNAVIPLVQYRDAIRDFCAADGHHFEDMFGEWGTITVETANGMFKDPVHPNVPGGYRLASRIKSKHLNL